VRNWARKLNREEALIHLTTQPYRGPERRAATSAAETEVLSHIPPAPFISVSAPSDSGADAQIRFPTLDAKDIHIEQEIRPRIHLA
jgi:hypothetical protein